MTIILWCLNYYFDLKLRNREYGSGHAMVLGLLLGLALLVKESGFILVVSIIVGLLWSGERGHMLKYRIVPIVLMVMLVLTPWALRNFAVQGRIIPIRTGMGVNLWVADHPGAYGGLWKPNGQKTISDFPYEYQRYLDANTPDDEQERDDFYGEKPSSLSPPGRLTI